VADAVKEAQKILTKAGYGKVCYGPIILVDELTGYFRRDRVAGRYVHEDDTVFLAFDTARIDPLKMDKWVKDNKRNLVFVIVHELAHRIWFKFLSTRERTFFTALSQASSKRLYDQIKHLRSQGLSYDTINKKVDASEFISSYAQKDDWEDFAESLALYLMFPQRRRDRGMERLKYAGIIKESVDREKLEGLI